MLDNSQSNSDSTLRRWILDHIASGEASRYNELYGGGSFDNFADHPRQSIPLGDGRYTTAAGRYQFLSSTWDDEAKRLGLRDFSPTSQDAAAWDLASRTYQNATGESLLDAARAGKIDWRALGSQWTSLANSGAPQSSTNAPSASVESGGTAESGMSMSNGNSASALGPMQALALLQQLAPHLTFTPVDYDPFKVEQSNG